MSTFYSENDPERSSYPPRSGHAARPADQTPLLGCLLAVALVVVVLLPLGLVAYWYWGQRPVANPADALPRPVEARGDLSEMEKANIDVYERLAPSVVHVTNLAERGSPFSMNVQRVPRGTGSGFVWDQDGHIVTNYHVVEGADAAQVTLSDHTTYEATRVWAYPDKDIAVLTIAAPRGKLRPIPVGTSHDLKVGQVTYAIGNPFGLDQTLTTGIVSALGREIEAEGERAPITGAIQTNAAINPGNSGGPLLDSAGRLIGMNTAILSPSGTFAGIGFAIPVDEVNRIVPQLIGNQGKIVHPGLGVQWAEDQLARRLGVDDGALILKVDPNGPAAKAGLQGTYRDRGGRIRLGDVVVAINGDAVHSGIDAQNALEKYKVGETITVTVERNGERQDVKVQLTARQ
jgi:S1-C subfamily serine protease